MALGPYMLSGASPELTGGVCSGPRLTSSTRKEELPLWGAHAPALLPTVVPAGSRVSRGRAFGAQGGLWGESDEDSKCLL